MYMYAYYRADSLLKRKPTDTLRPHMDGERDIPFSMNHLFPQQVLRSREEMADELSRPCGRFKPLKTLEDTLASFIAEHIRSVDPLGSGQIFAGTGFPLNWQYVLTYLYEHGVIANQHFYEQPVANDRPKYQKFLIGLNKTARKTDGIVAGYAAFGASMSTEEAISKAIGEGLERYFLSVYTRGAMPYASYTSLRQKSSKVFDIRQLNGFLPSQKVMFPELDWSTDSPLYWVEGEEYPTGAPVHIPAQLVFWNYRHGDSELNRQEKTLVQGTTSGCAGHFSKDEAVLAGLLEHIQRDAFLIFWLNHLSPPVLDVSLLNDPDVEEFVEYCKRYRLDITFLNTTADIKVPSVTCVVTDRSSPGEPVISLGGGTGFDIKNILIHSAIEALSVNEYASSLPTYEIDDAYTPFGDKSLGRDSRLSAWKGARMAERFSFFTAGHKQDPRELLSLTEGKDTPEKQLEYVLQCLGNMGAGYEVFIFEARDKVLDALGFHVVRTIVPQLLPLHLLEYAATLDSKRLKSVPGTLGYESAANPNPWPHPFP